MMPWLVPISAAGPAGILISSVNEEINGCISNNILATAGSQVTKSTGTVAREADITIDAFDLCNNVEVGTTNGGAAAPAVSFTGDLRDGQSAAPFGDMMRSLPWSS
jgi:hypothetical protein